MNVHAVLWIVMLSSAPEHLIVYINNKHTSPMARGPRHTCIHVIGGAGTRVRLHTDIDVHAYHLKF